MIRKGIEKTRNEVNESSSFIRGFEAGKNSFTKEEKTDKIELYKNRTSMDQSQNLFLKLYK